MIEPGYEELVAVLHEALDQVQMPNKKDIKTKQGHKMKNLFLSF